METSASAVQSLRLRTGVSILECKKALDEASGDEEKAIEILRKRGLAQAAKKAGREQHQGAVFSAVSSGKGALVVVLCETDFVARAEDVQAMGKTLAETALQSGADAAKKKSEELTPAAVQKLGENITLGEVHVIEAPVVGSYVHSNQKIGVLIGLSAGEEIIAKDVAMHAAAMNPTYTVPEEVAEDMLAKERDIWKDQMAKDPKPKPADIQEKILAGKEKKFREENALVTQAFAKDPSKVVQQVIGDAKVTDYVRVSIGA